MKIDHLRGRKEKSDTLLQAGARQVPLSDRSAIKLEIMNKGLNEKANRFKIKNHFGK